MSDSNESTRISDAVKRMLPKRVKSWVRKSRRRRDQKNRFINSLLDSDTFLIGHPKSGNTWTAYMLGIVQNRDLGQRIRMADIGRFVPTIHNRDSAITEFPDLPSPRIFRNEAPQFPERYPRTIYLIRDPRAVLLSYYHHCVHDTGDTDWPIESFVDEMLTHGCISSREPHLVRWDIQVKHWIDRATTQPVLFVRYEDLKQDQRGGLEKMVRFLGMPLDSEVIDHAIERTSFSSMRNEEKLHGCESYAGEKGAKGFFVRKGKVDSWKEEMPAAAIRKIEDAYGSVMQQLGYTI
jgi:hypothetical protein